MRVITLDINKIIISVKNVGNNYMLQENEIETNLGETGQIQQEDGTFITPPPVEVTPQPTLEDKIAELNDNQLTIMSAIADLYIAIETSTV